jgi:pimeloyl-ACP methyl ester carboxylesterase
LENIREHLKIDKWIVIGHSFGGFVALEYVLRYAQCVSQLCIIEKAGHNTSIECPDKLINLMLSFFKNKTA